jgi:iron complex outermembrane receptor protein
MRKILVITLAVMVIVSSARADEPKKLDKIVVTASRLDTLEGETSRSVTILDPAALEESNYQAIPDAIGNVGGIDIRRRGPEGIQADVNIRGTTFEQNTVLVNGIVVNDPQTGHFNMDIPLAMMDIDAIEILKGPASSLYGPNSFGGVINIITRKPQDKEFLFYSEGGSYDYYRGGISLSYPAGPIKNRFSIEESRSTGYMPETQFNNLTLTETATLETPFGSYDLLFGYMKKDFGAANFYSNLYPNELESTDTRLFELKGHIERHGLKFEPKLFLRRHWDKFALDANRPGWQTNYHTTYNYGLAADFVIEDKFMDVAYGYELSQDTTDSTNLQTHSRTKDGFYVEVSPHIIDALKINAGMREDYISDFGWRCSPMVSASILPAKDLTIRMAIGKAFRIPTFTDLYYNDAANKGSPSLGPESSWSYEAGIDYRKDRYDVSATYFNRETEDTIDWTRTTSKLPWQASNIGTAKTNGFELAVDASPRKIDSRIPIDNIFFGYTCIDTYAKHGYLSKYALDYLKQQISGGLECSLFGFKNSWVINYKKRIGDSGYMTVDTKLVKGIIKQKKLDLEAYFEISNIFDVEYSEQSNVQMPGRWIKSGGTIKF